MCSATVYDGKCLVVEEIQKEEASSSAAPTTEVAINDPSASSTINIADLLELVKGEAATYIPTEAATYIPKPSSVQSDAVDWEGTRGDGPFVLTKNTRGRFLGRGLDREGERGAGRLPALQRRTAGAQ